jgi:hypothetical protein
LEKAKGRSRTELNKANYEIYVNKLRKSEKGFPVNKSGNANLAKIAKECDFGRDRLYEGSPLHLRFKQDLSDIGLEGGSNKTQKDDYNAKKATQKSKDASALQVQLDIKVQELFILREKYERIETELKTLKRQRSEHSAAMDELENTGRRSFI